MYLNRDTPQTSAYLGRNGEIPPKNKKSPCLTKRSENTLPALGMITDPKLMCDVVNSMNKQAKRKKSQDVKSLKHLQTQMGFPIKKEPMTKLYSVFHGLKASKKEPFRTTNPEAPPEEVKRARGLSRLYYREPSDVYLTSSSIRKEKNKVLNLAAVNLSTRNAVESVMKVHRKIANRTTFYIK